MTVVNWEGLSKPLQQIFQDRMKRLASRPVIERAAEDAQQIAVCTLGQERYGLDVAYVREVAAFQGCTLVPMSAHELLGVMSIRGEIRPILSLSRLVGLPEPSNENDGYVLLLGKETSVVGLRVDGVLGIQRVPLISVQPKTTGRALESAYIKGWVNEGLLMIAAEAVLNWQNPSHKGEHHAGTHR